MWRSLVFLASIALPAYQTYIAKAKFSEVILATSGVKTAIEVCAQTASSVNNCGTANDGSVNVAATNANGGDSVNTVAATAALEVAKITATPLKINGIETTDTYIIDGTFSSGRVTWVLDSTNSGCFTTGLCK